MKESRRLLKADLHVHTRHSRLEAFPILGARDCYSEPGEVYRQARARGMDLVTFTDHDTIDGCLELLETAGDLNDFFISEEVSARDPKTGCRLHVSVYGIDESRHREIQRLRGNVRELLGYLERERIPAALNHLGSSLVHSRLTGEALLELLSEFPLLETRNGAQRPASNSLACGVSEILSLRGRRIGGTGGSDAHTTHRIGRTWTEAVADGKGSFLEALRSREVAPGGSSARLGAMVRDVYAIVLGYYLDLLENRQGHFEPRARRGAAACALVSLPLHLVALPATGTAFRQLRVHASVRRTARELSRTAATPDSQGSSAPSMAWIPAPESEET